METENIETDYSVKEERKTYILGGGISGLIYSYYSGLPIISKNLGGQMKTEKKWHLGPRYLHVDEFSTRLLKDLKLDAPIKDVHIGRYMDGWTEVNEEFRKKYYKKTRKSDKKYIPSSSSGGATTFKNYHISMQRIIDALIRGCKSEIIREDVKKIDIDKRELILESGRIFTYSKLISTIPAPAFQKLLGIELGKFECLKKTFVLTDKHFDLKDFDYVYYADDRKYHRVTKCPEIENHFVIEYVGDDYKECPENIKEVDKSELWIGQIMDSANFTDDLVKDIKFVGRYAQWKHNILTNQIIKKALEHGERNDG